MPLVPAIPPSESDHVRDALLTLRRATGLPVAFAGAVLGGGAQMRLGELIGTTTGSLRGLVVTSGFGLGGKAFALGRPLAVSDYQAARTISHEYDGAVSAEGLRSVLAVPVVVRRVVRAVLYGATREPLAFGDRVISAAIEGARQLEQDLVVRDEARRMLAALAAHRDTDATRRADLLEAGVHPGDGGSAGTAGSPPGAESPGSAEWEEVRHVHAELRTLAQRVPDPDLRQRLSGLTDRLAAASRPAGSATPPALRLSPRETDVLACVAIGCTNAEAARQLGLLPETIKSYLRSAMRKLGAHTRLEAVTTARRTGLLP
ncbi:helix-turn-helix transcriptional regulator [Sphaerisporangium fuscum]|uniref:helix-turn-helix transcriptional regulator n=1 Tax=Sphaerisporangium fuscum TaxID=2835868 RepID=UPI0027E300EE|nr:helix-turn-helix transcriptional regulator [Sphaerisporangium fuscum]